MLVMLGHIGLAQILAQPKVQLTDREASAYTESLVEFGRWHLPAFDARGKRGSEIGLIMTVGGIYLLKAIEIIADKKNAAHGEGGIAAEPAQAA